jgi:superfamily II DNA or RNA helicase
MRKECWSQRVAILAKALTMPRLDTLFLTLPISWRGTLAQYAGRLHRLHTTKREVIIYDYIDRNEPLLVKMAAKREAGYRSLGYRVVDEAELRLLGSPQSNCIRLPSPHHLLAAPTVG